VPPVDQQKRGLMQWLLTGESEGGHMRDRDYLFASGDLSASIEGHRQKMQQQIHALAPNQLLAGR
jgi:hypothetical protein